MSDKIQDVEVERIFLYEENPRHEKLETQEEIIAYLCRGEQVLELASSICQDGTNPLELVGLVEKTKPGKKGAKKTYEVWEGNRRICAIQLLNDPERAPAKQRAKFERLAQSYSRIKTLPAVVFANRARLKFWMANIHGGEQGGIGRKQWKADAKARASGTSSRHAVALALLDKAEEFELITKEQRKNKLTTLDRYTQNPQVKDALGLNTSDIQAIKTDLTDEDFESTLRVLIGDLLDGAITSRHNAPQIRPYARKLPNRAGASTERVEPRLITKVGHEEAIPKIGKKQKTKPKKPVSPTKVVPSEELQLSLDRHETNKHAQFYYSICDVSAVDHPQLIAIGCWAFIESLTALAGRNEDTSFQSFYSMSRLESYGFPKSQKRSSLIQSLKRLADGGNTTKHHPTSATYDAKQLINDMETVTPLLIATVKSIL